MLYECLTGEPPFARESELAAVYAHLNEPPPRASDVAARARRGPRRRDREGARRRSRTTATRAPASSRQASQAALRGELAAARRRAAVVALGALAAAVLAAAALVVAGSSRTTATAAGSPPRLAIAPKTMGLIDATSHEVVGRIPFASQPWDVVFDADQAWVLLGDERRVARVDLARRARCSRRRGSRSCPAPSRRAPAGRGSPRTTGRGSCAGSRQRADREAVLRPDPGRRRCELAGIAVGAGSVWVARGPETVRVDPASGGVTKRFLTPLAPTSVVFANGEVWVASAENGGWMKIDPATNRIAPTSLHAEDHRPGGRQRVGVGLSSPTTSSTGSAPTTERAATPRRPVAVVASVGDGLWVANARGRALDRIDSSGARSTRSRCWVRRSYPLPRRPAVDIRRRRPSRSRHAPGRTLRMPLE